MAYSSADVASAARTAAANDIPMLLAAHCLRDTGVSVIKWNDGGTTADTDETADFAPLARVYDEFCNAGNHSKPSSGKATFYLVVQFSAGVTLDVVGLVGSNLEDATTITVEIADNNTFTTNLLEIASLDPLISAGQMRVFELELGSGNAKQYSNVEYMRVKFTGSSYVPRVRELWVGQRRQLLYNPQLPLEDEHSKSIIGVNDSKSGVLTHSAFETGGVLRAPQFTLDTTDAATAGSFWEECNYGTSPFWWIETPGSDPQPYLMRYDGDPELAAPIIGNNVREWVLPMREEAPFLAYEP